MATAATGKKRLTQSEVINHFAEKTGLKRAQVKEFFEEVATLAAREVKTNGEFVLPGFGKLVKSEEKLARAAIQPPARQFRFPPNYAEVPRRQGAEGHSSPEKVRRAFQNRIQKHLGASGFTLGGHWGGADVASSVSQCSQCNALDHHPRSLRLNSVW
jgi:nucleoid DNA-binding protein